MLVLHAANLDVLIQERDESGPDVLHSLPIAGYIARPFSANSPNLALTAAWAGAMQAGRSLRASWSHYFRDASLKMLQSRWMMHV